MISVRPYLVFLAAGNCLLFQPIFFLYYAEHVGLATSTVLGVQSWALVVRSGLDLPFGMLADRWSRRGCLAASAAMQTIGALLVLAWPTWIAVLVAETAFGVASALRSGADSAFLYDTFRGAGATHAYPAAESRAQAVAAIGSGVGAVAGGALGSWDLRAPYVCSVVATLIATAAALRLREPPHDGAGVHWRQLPEVARLAATRAELRWAIGLSAFAVTISHVYFFLQQPYLATIGMPVAMFGVLFAATKVLTALVANVAHRVDAAYGERGAAAAMALAPTVGLGTMGGVGAAWAGALVLTRGILDGLWQPLVNVFLNRRIDSARRATMLSLQSVVARLSLAGTLAVVSRVVDVAGVAAVLGAMAGITAVLGVVFVLSARAESAPAAPI